MQRSFLTAGIQSVGTQGGDIVLNAKEKITIANSQISNDLGSLVSQPVGNTGGIYIKAGSVNIINDSTLSADTYGKGNTTGIFVQANSSVDILDESLLSSSVNSTAAGNTGGIHIKAGSLNLINGSTLNANSFGQGETTGIFVQANGAVLVNDSTISTEARATGTGNGSDINIQAGTISLTDNAALDSITYREGTAGKVMIDAGNSISVDKSLISSQTAGPGNAGIIDIKTRDLSLTKGGVISSTTTGQGMAGNIQIKASDIIISGVNPEEGFSSGLITSSQKPGNGRGGEINITTNRLQVLDGGILNARTRSASNGGDITVNTNTLELTGGGQLLTSAFSSGNAGNITINATDRVSMSGSDPTFAARREQFGEATVDNDGSNSGLFARVRGNQVANAGKIEVNAGSIHLDKQGTITTETTLGEGGDITLRVRDILLLRKNSSITATAGTQRAGGNGGNITINAPNGFIVAVPNENSDITANAFEGSGGRVTINATDIYGIAPLSRQEIERLRPDDLDPSKLQTNDITAISQTNPSFSGTVEVNTPDVDLSRGLINLPTLPVDTQLASGCNSPNYAQSSFIITGRGGLPPNPKDILTPDAVQVDWVTLNPNIDKGKSSSVSTNPTNPTPEPIVEATGWVFNAKGEVVFTASAPTTTPRSSWNKSAGCRT
ncbi:hypothetical protein DP117_23555 [Brasilonema sp. UFV-L1]|nr:hypothetical protein [Brasilonema sp. UFV-L1]